MADLPNRIGFAGTPDFAARILDALLAADANVVVAYTRPDKPTGRGRKLTPSAVKQQALQAGIEVCQPKSLRAAEAQNTLQRYDLDVLVVAAYGLILPRAALDAPRQGCLNVHASLLPRWRGAAPIERAIMAGDAASGVSIMRMEEGLDTGGVYQQRSCPITDQTTGQELHDLIADLGSAALIDTLTNFEPDGWEPQDDALATYADKLDVNDAQIDWRADAAAVARQINALNDRLPARSYLPSTTQTGDAAPEPVFFLRASPIATPSDTAQPQPGELLARNKKTVAVACGSGAVNIHEVQLRRGKGRPMPMAAALNGYSELFSVGQVFSGAAQDSQTGG